MSYNFLFILQGNSGLQLTKQALDRGHEVTAIVRNPAKLDFLTSNPKFKVIFMKI